MNFKLLFSLVLFIKINIVHGVAFSSIKHNILCEKQDAIKKKIIKTNDTIPLKSEAELRDEKYINETNAYQAKIDLVKKGLREINRTGGQIKSDKNDSLGPVTNSQTKKESIAARRSSNLLIEKVSHQAKVEEKRRLQLELLAERRKKALREVPNQVIIESDKTLSNNIKRKSGPIQKEARYANIKKKIISKKEHVLAHEKNQAENDKDYIVENLASDDDRLNATKVAVDENNSTVIESDNISNLKEKSKIEKIFIENENSGRPKVNASNQLVASDEKAKSIKPTDVVSTDTKDLDFVYHEEENFEHLLVNEMLIKIDALEKIKNKIESQHNYFLSRTADDLENDWLSKHHMQSNETDISDMMSVLNMLDKIEEMEVKKNKLNYNLAYFKAREEYLKDPERYNQKVAAMTDKKEKNESEMLRRIDQLQSAKTKIENNHAYFLSRVVDKMDDEVK